MKSYSSFLTIRTNNKEEIIDITGNVRKVCKESGIKEGFMMVFPHHTSCAVYLSDSDPALTRDLRKILSKVCPKDDDYEHNQTDFKKNADAHLKAILSGHHVVIPISDGELDLGVYQTIYYAEFDGQREKEIMIKIIGD